MSPLAPRLLLRALLRRLLAGPPAPSPGPFRRYRVRYHYTEQVRGEPRSYVFDKEFHARGTEEVRAAAVAYFEATARDSGVGWARRLDRLDVQPDG